MIRGSRWRDVPTRGWLVLGWSLGTGCHEAALPSGEIVADSVRGFSGRQGTGGWYYGYWDRSADADDHYDPTDDFRRLVHFGGDPINRLSGRREFTTGALWNLEDGRYYTSLWARGGHAHGTMDLGDHARAEQWAVRRWVSTIRGPLTIQGHAGKVMPWGENWSGGVRTSIVVDGVTLWSADIGERGTDYSVDATVEVGSLVDFVIAPDPSIGVVELTATLRAASAAARLESR